MEEGKLVRAQLELAQVKADIDRRIHEKEEEFEVTRLDVLDKTEHTSKYQLPAEIQKIHSLPLNSNFLFHHDLCICSFQKEPRTRSGVAAGHPGGRG